MTPLGWANAGIAPYLALPAGPACLICSATRLTPRARLQHQTQIASEDVAFLPLSPNSTATVEACLTWAEEHADDLITWLDTVRGLAQFTMAFTVPTAVPSAGTWLRNRAALHHNRAASLDILKARADALLAPLSAQRWHLRDSRNGPALDALAPRLQHPAKALPAMEDAGAALKGWSLNIVGPLPAYGFAPESALA